MADKPLLHAIKIGTEHVSIVAIRIPARLKTRLTPKRHSEKKSCSKIFHTEKSLESNFAACSNFPLRNNLILDRSKFVD